MYGNPVSTSSDIDALQQLYALLMFSPLDIWLKVLSQDGRLTTRHSKLCSPQISRNDGKDN